MIAKTVVGEWQQDPAVLDLLITSLRELAGNEWTRLVIGVPDAHAEAACINAAVARRDLNY